MLSVPDDLRNVLEQCLAEEASPENLDLYLPNVRQIITSLLQGLRSKQAIYRKIHRESGHERTDSKSRTNPSRREGTQRSNGSRTHTQDGSDGITSSRRSRKRETPVSQVGANGSGEVVGGFIPTVAEQTTGQSDDHTSYSDSQRRQERSVPSSSLNPSTEPGELPPRSGSTTPAVEEPPPPSSSPPLVPPNIKRYSLVDKPMDKPAAAPTVVIQPSSPFNGQDVIDSPQSETLPPLSDPPSAVAKSLAALKSNDVLLERRASKRFSTYNISKMTGGSTTRERSLRSNPAQSNRRSLGELTALPEGDEEGGQADEPRQSPDRTAVPPMPSLPISPAKTPEPTAAQDGKQRVHAVSSKVTVFLQLGREVKKVSVDPGISFSALRVLFVDKFSYNPGLENFPAIYIRDPSSQVQYELEDTDEVKDDCLLSLNIERKISYVFENIMLIGLQLLIKSNNILTLRLPVSRVISGISSSLWRRGISNLKWSTFRPPQPWRKVRQPCVDLVKNSFSPSQGDCQDSSVMGPHLPLLYRHHNHCHRPPCFPFRHN